MFKKLLVFVILTSSFSFGQKLKIGDKAPEIAPEEWFYSKDYFENTSKTTLTIVDFWFTHCAPCVATIPDFNQIKAKYPFIKVVSVTFDDKQTIEEFSKKVALTYPVGIDSEKKVISAFGVYGYPKTFIINEKGKIIWEGYPVGVQKKLEQILINRNELIPTEFKEQTNSILSQSNQESFSFSLKPHDIGMGGSSSTNLIETGAILLNKKLKDILFRYFGITSARLHSSDLDLEKSYDVKLTMSKPEVDGKNSLTLLKYNLLKELGIRLQGFEVEENYYSLVSLDDLKLVKSDDNFFGVTTTRDGTWKATGAKLKDVKDFIENYYNKLVALKTESDTLYNFTLPIDNWEALISELKTTYGIEMELTSGKMIVYDVLKN